jgi:hypothetical protein
MERSELAMIGRTISVDIDSDMPFRALKTYFNMAYFLNKVFCCKSVFKGFHFWAVVPQNLTLEQICNMRLAFGDDRARVDFDIRKDVYGKPKQVLFTKKKGKEKEKLVLGWKAIPQPFKNSHKPQPKRGVG